ncbi:DUF3084 domain-containing protein [Sporomusa acidovorans]|uniref:DUF3084 domain-containing protein n=1 Tax=Sporomusa acidovorans TaxID=112900 RepID=UPI00088F44A1|nr:DUF3084 domain-containing protein [Sporomusa acidovorans]OZC19118.1 chromosome partition protein Smc [Sporomusa acidovorans DSM 3132]SDD67826.1 Protein of unknown function [Sporomusa acidovorans]
MFGLVLIAILGIMGGAIAYIGDKIGTKVGKKKLSLFGLRPKYTSIIVAVTTGILITASTLTILTIVSYDVRTALFGMEKIRGELTALSSEVTQKNRQLEDNQLLLQAKEQEYNHLVSQINAVTNQLSHARTELVNALEEHDQTMAALTKVQVDLAKANTDIAALETTKGKLDTRIAELTRVRDTLKSDADRLSKTTAQLNSGIKYLRAETVLYRANEVLATAVIDTSVEQVQNELLRVISETNRKVLQKIGKQGTEAEVLWISQADFQNATKALQKSDSSMVVRIVAHENTVWNEAVIAYLEVYPNKQIFAKGETIAKTTINVQENRGSIEPVVLQFLQQVNRIAVEKGVLADPLQGTVGSISGTELFNVVNQLEKKGGIVQLRAVALADTSVAGPLEIKIVIEHP